MSPEETDDPRFEAQWILKEHGIVEAYLRAQGVDHGGVADAPDWFIRPYFAVWRIGSVIRPGTTGWWAVSGDVPTDYLSGSDARTPREAVAAIAHRWKEAAEYMLRGEEHPEIRIGRKQDSSELGDLLARRAELLMEWVEDEEMWRGEGE